jgi:hypothetical protein
MRAPVIFHDLNAEGKWDGSVEAASISVCKTETDLEIFKILIEGREFLLYPLSRKESQVSSYRYSFILDTCRIKVKSYKGTKYCD